MTNSAKITTTVLLLLVLTGIGAADYYLAGRESVADVVGQQQTNGTAKAGEGNPEDILRAINVTVQPSEDLTFLAQVAKNAPVRSVIILQDGDRAGSVSWLDGDSKQAFIALKEALLSAFSAQVSALSDTTIQEEGKPTRNVLTFRDPALSEETLTFVRVRERLYEFHTTAGKEAVMKQAVDALTKVERGTSL